MYCLFLINLLQIFLPLQKNCADCFSCTRIVRAALAAHKKPINRQLKQPVLLTIFIMTTSKNLWLPALEIFLLEVAVFMALWLINPFWAGFLTIIIVTIGIPILLIALIAEWLERTRISRLYFVAMLMSILVPPLVAVVYNFLSGNGWNFLKF